MIGKLCRQFSTTIPVARKLREVMKISIVEKEDKSTIKDIWTKFHASKQHLVAKATDYSNPDTRGRAVRRTPNKIEGESDVHLSSEARRRPFYSGRSGSRQYTRKVK